MTNEEFVKALKLQQEAFNDNMKRMSDYTEQAFASKEAVEQAYAQGVQEAE